MSLILAYENQGWKILNRNTCALFQLAKINNRGNTNARRILIISGSNNKSTDLNMRGI